MTGRKNRTMQVPVVVPYKALENFSKALYETTRGTYSAPFFRPVMSDDSDLYECQMPLPPLPKKRRRTIFTKCIICQMDFKDKLRKGKGTSVANFVSKLNVRRDSVYEKLSPDLELLYENEVLWHASCYATYTSTQNIKYAAVSKTSVVVEEDMEEESPESSSRVLRSSIHPQDWSKCLFCKNRTYKKEKIMQNVSTIEAANTVRQSAEAKGD